MPIADLRFPQFPAEIDHPAVVKLREIAQTDVQVLHEDPHFLNGLDTVADALERPNVAGPGEAASVHLSLGARSLDLSMTADQHLFFLFYSQQALLKLRKQLFCFGQGKGTFVHGRQYDTKAN